MTRFAGLLLALLVALPAPAQQGSQPMHQRFDDAERWAKVFDDPARDAWQKPDEVIRALKLAPEAAVADIPEEKSKMPGMPGGGGGMGDMY